MGNQIVKSTTSEISSENTTLNVKPALKPNNITLSDSEQRLNHLRSMTYYTRSNRIITLDQIYPNSSDFRSDSVTHRVSSEETTRNVSPLLDYGKRAEQKPSKLVVVEFKSADLPHQVDNSPVVEEISCPICFSTISIKSPSITTICNHTFCKSCLQKVFDHSKYDNTCTIVCPICRGEINREVLYVEITPQTFVDNPDLSFIQNEHTRHMVLDAYTIIHKHNLWGKLRAVTPNELEGFMFSKNPEIVQIMKLINEENGYHSGASLSHTMRVMQQISRYGYESLRLIRGQNAF
jgi:hypothetical protein